jgi:HK97 family phage major capsid protein
LTINAAIKESLDEIKNATTEAIGSVKTEVQQLAQRTDQVEAVLRRPGAGGGHANDNSDLRHEIKALTTFIRSGDDSDLKDIQASMSVGSDPDGGYLVLPQYSTTLTKRLYDATPMRRLARVETITTGSEWVEPVDKGESGAVWVGEQSARPATDTPKLAQIRIPLEEVYALQPITQRLVDDGGFDLGSWIEGKISDKFARTEGSAFVTGNGTNKPRGFLTYDTSTDDDFTRPWNNLQTVLSGHATEIMGDGLKNLVWSLRAPYRAGASWLMNSNTASKLDKLKDGQGNYLWRIGVQAGAPNELLGYPVEFDETMPDVEAGSHSIAFGNIKLAYVIIDRAGIKFLRDPFTNKPNVLFYGYKRVGGGVANSEAIKLLKTGT